MNKITLILIGVFVLILFIALPFMASDNASSPPSQSDEKLKVSRDYQNDPEMKEIRINRLSREFVVANLKDPDSAEFRNQNGFCGEVNAKNGLGGYTGFKRFIATDKSLVVMEDALPLDDFNEAWAKVCS